MIDLMIELLSKISQVNSSPASIVLNQIFTNTDFLDVIRKKLKLEQYNDTKYLEVFYNIAKLNNKLIDKFTDDTLRIKYSELSEYSDVLQELVTKGKVGNNMQLCLNIIDTLNDLKEKEKHKKLITFEEKQKKIENEKLEQNPNNYSNNKIPNINLIPIDYKQRKIQLTDEDFNNNQSIEIAPHISKGSYTSYERYINTRFYF